jgi:hypothetical protein
MWRNGPLADTANLLFICAWCRESKELLANPIKICRNAEEMVLIEVLPPRAPPARSGLTHVLASAPRPLRSRSLRSTRFGSASASSRRTTSSASCAASSPTSSCRGRSSSLSCDGSRSRWVPCHPDIKPPHSPLALSSHAAVLFPEDELR